MNPTQNISLAGLSVEELNTLLAQYTTQLANQNAQIASAPVLAKQQLAQRLTALASQVKNTETQIETINSTITALNNPAQEVKSTEANSA